jgi:hypothetical protein
LILAAILLIIGFGLFMIGFVWDLLAVNRKLLEDIQYNLRKNKVNKKWIENVEFLEKI